MNKEELKKIFDDNEDAFLRFDEEVVNKLSSRPDLHAFILLDSICPSGNDIVVGAEHDEIYIDVDIEELAKKATEEQIVDLIRCGIRFSSGEDMLCMFV